MPRPLVQSAFTAALGLLLVTSLKIPFEPTPAPAPLTCGTASSVITVSRLTIPAGADITYPVDTAIRADTVWIDGSLRTLDALAGSDAPGLCIEAETLALGSSATLCTGGGAPGLDVATHDVAAGGAGTAGGPLRIFIADRAATPAAPAVQIAPGARLCTGDGGPGGLGGVLDDCTGRAAQARGGDGGDAGRLQFHYAGPEDRLALAPESISIGAGGPGGRAIAASLGPTEAVGGAGGASDGSFDGIPQALVQAALAASRGGDGGAALAAGNVCRECDGDPRSCLADCLVAHDRPRCAFLVVADEACELRPGPACTLAHGCRTANPFPECATVGAPGDSETDRGDHAVKPGSNGKDGKDAEAHVAGWFSCRTEPATPGDGGGIGQAGGDATATGGPGDYGLLHGGDGGYAEASAGNGARGGNGGRGGNGIEAGALLIQCHAQPCQEGGAGGPGGLAGKPSATGGTGGRAGVGNGGNGGSVAAIEGDGGPGGHGGNGGIHKTHLCEGGCGGDGGKSVDGLRQPGSPGWGPAGPGAHGRDVGHDDQGQHGLRGREGVAQKECTYG